MYRPPTGCDFPRHRNFRQTVPDAWNLSSSEKDWTKSDIAINIIIVYLSTWYSAQLESKVKPGIICLETTHLDPQKVM